MSAITNETSISVTGTAQDLQAFQAFLGPQTTTDFAHVNAWYHGGDQLASVVEASLEDAAGIDFPSQDDLMAPIRSSFDGSVYSAEASSSVPLVDWIVGHLFTYPIDWVRTGKELSAALVDYASSSLNRPCILSFGPSSEVLFASLKPLLTTSEGKVSTDLLDVSSFTNIGASRSDIRPSDIAIVGQGFNLPIGADPQELWQSLSEGLSAVSEVSTARFIPFLGPD